MSLNVFEWKPSEHVPGIPIDQMNTTHLYNTLRMVWNYVAPEYLKIHPYREHKFGKFYTADYMAAAIQALVEELKNRTGLSIRAAKDLRFIIRSMEE